MKKDEKRYCTIAQSLEDALKQMKNMRNGKVPKKTWKEFREEQRA
jgi:transposase